MYLYLNGLETFILYFNAFMKLFKLSFNMFGFQISFWQVFLFVCFSAIIGRFLGGVLK